jgi:hypothetical protein
MPTRIALVGELLFKVSGMTSEPETAQTGDEKEMAESSRPALMEDTSRTY